MEGARRFLQDRPKGMERAAVGSPSRGISWACLLCVLLNLLALTSSPAGSAKGLVLPFSTLHQKTAKFGNRPRNLWTCGEFTAWGRVREGVFAAGFPKLFSYTALQKLAPFSVLPTEPLVQIAICETEFPIPGLKEGRRFEISESEPAEVLEMLQGSCFYARLRLSAAPKPLWKEEKEEAGAEAAGGGVESPSADRGRRRSQREGARGKAGTVAKEPPMLLHIADIARAYKKQGTRPAQTWTYGRFFVDTDVQNGLFLAHESGLPTRRVVEGLLASAAIFPFGERFDTAIFSSRLRNLPIGKKCVIEIDKEHPARVEEIVPAGGLLVRLDLDYEPVVEGVDAARAHGAKDFFSPVVRLFSP